ncbi:MAG: Hsp20/alpha crystallin family protein [Alphaproteobacteria bacterium]
MSLAMKKDLPITKGKDTAPVTGTERHPLLGLRQEVDTLFDNFFSNFTFGPFGRYASDFDPFRRVGTALAAHGGFMPSMDIRENDDAFHISVELPGMSEDDIELTISDGNLVIKGEKKEEKTTDEENCHLTERHYGSIYRSMPLPESVNEDKVDASVTDGVLNITLGKTAKKEKTEKTVKIKGT